MSVTIVLAGLYGLLWLPLLGHLLVHGIQHLILHWLEHHEGLATAVLAVALWGALVVVPVFTWMAWRTGASLWWWGIADVVFLIAILRRVVANSGH